MAIKLGSTNFGMIYLGSTKIGQAYLGGVKVFPHKPNYNPLNLPAYTIRLQYTNGETPSFLYGTAVQVSSSPNVWDLTYNNGDWQGLLSNHYYGGRGELQKVLGANASGVTNMYRMFYLSSVREVALFDTSSAVDMRGMFSNTALNVCPAFDTSKATQMSSMFSECPYLKTVPRLNMSRNRTMNAMFYQCTSLKSIPLFDTSSVTDMYQAFYQCTYVEGGALALYQQASSQAVPPQYHGQCFFSCGSSTQTGSAELAQIPSDWKT